MCNGERGKGMENNCGRPGNRFLLYRAAWEGIYGTHIVCGTAEFTDALFVYLDGKPDPESAAVLEKSYTGRPWVCLTEDWETHVRERYPGINVYTRYRMKPAAGFSLPEEKPLPGGCTLSRMDEAAFMEHPFSHGCNYATYADFSRLGSGAVVRRGGEIVSSASSFLSLEGEVEMDVSTKPDWRGKGLAAACIREMLLDCMERKLTVHWDAQNETSRHLAEKFGFEQDEAYRVYCLPKKG